MRFDEYTAEERRAAGRKGGLNSGRTRRARREAIEREKIHDAAMNEMRDENARMIRQATWILLNAKWAEERAR